MLKKSLLAIAAALGIFLLYFYLTLYPMIPIGTGYAAKKVCTCHFVAGMSQDQVHNEDLAKPSLNLAKTQIDANAKSVTATIFGMGAKTAVFRGDLGCVLLQGEDDYHVQLSLPKIRKNMVAEWPLGESTTTKKIKGVDYKALDQAIESVFDPSLAMESLQTRAVVVVFKDTLVAEKYAKGVDQNTPLLGWSMNKSIVSTLVGILVKKGKMNLTDSQLFEEWTDERQNITLTDMLHMQSGLAFVEDYGAASDVNKMLFLSENMVADLLQDPLDAPIGEKWYYSSGTTNLLAGLIRNEFESDNEYHRFPHDALFRKIGMHSMVLETDEAGNFIGSSYGYATPRDWAKFGLLYMNEGNWYGEQIIDTSWVEFVRKPTDISDGLYGGQFWHNQDHISYKDVPADLYSCNGFEGQYVFIIPSLDLVVVRMGLSDEFDKNAFLSSIIQSVSPSQQG